MRLQFRQQQKPPHRANGRGHDTEGVTSMRGNPKHSGGTPRNTPESFWARVTDNPETGCREWQGATDSRGYGVLCFTAITGSNQTIRAHRAAWALTHGSLPDSGHIHHTCENKRCVNPDHLQLLTPRQHLRAHNGDTCAAGHGPAHWRIRASGSRFCRECDRQRQIAHRAARSVPCLNCGQPRMAVTDAGKRRNFTGLCRACYLESRRAVPS